MARQQGISFPEVLTRALKIGLHAMWTEDVLELESH
jgi:hypothetical protein